MDSFMENLIIKNNQKVIIWGHKLHSNTFSYIHYGYFEAFKSLGFEVHWFDNLDDISNFNFANSIFFTEGQVDDNIPLRKDCKYILHHCNKEKYKDYDHINLCNYVFDCTLGKSHNYQNDTVEKINYFTYFDRKNKALYQPWATTLPAEQFDEFVPLDHSIAEIFYVGTVWSENIQEMTKFNIGCVKNNKKLIICKTRSEEESRVFVKKSSVAPDVRLAHHVNVGYIPCRIFKNISYGKIPATNSKYVRDFFGKDLLPFANDPEDLVSINLDFYNSSKAKEVFSLLSNEVKEHHTFKTRANHLLSVI